MADGTKLLRLLKRVNLGGIIEEAVVDLDSCSVQAVDVTSSLFVNVAEESDIDGIGEVGIGNLALVCKYLEAFKGEIEIEVVENRLVIASKGRGKLKYLTTDPEFIPTSVKEGNIEALIEPCSISVALDKAKCADISTYFGLIKPKSAHFVFDAKAKKVIVNSGLSSDHQFTFDLGPATIIAGKKAAVSFDVEVYSSHIEAIFNVLEWTDEKKRPKIFMWRGEEPDFIHPAIIRQDENNMWALLPLEPAKGEEE